MQAYLDYRNFGTLPRAGGVFDQPGELMRELRIVAAIVQKRESEKAESGGEKSGGLRRWLGKRGR